MTLFGEVKIEEQLFQWEGYCLRPFQIESRISCRGYSLPLQRRVVDFAVDSSFESAQQKLKEHYGVDISKERIRQITYAHCAAVKQEQELQTEISVGPGKKQVVVEADGSMIPIIKGSADREAGTDLRKNKELEWREYRLTLAYENGTVDPIYGGSFGSVDEIGDQMLDVAIRAGVGRNTYIHAVGDGATWVSDQSERVFGSQAKYLIDFYHLCEYLALASQVMDEVAGGCWLEHAKKVCRQKNGVEKILRELKPYVEPGPVPEENAPVRQCYRYINNRYDQFHYFESEKVGLPIGSGRIESGNRSVIQSRLKKAGAWWKKENAELMIAMRIQRQNRDWHAYWTGKQAA